MTRPAEEERVQWYQSSGSGARSWRDYGITRVHLRDPERPGRTLCGVTVAPPSKLYPSPDAPGVNDCRRCHR